eukprot:7328382-Alexandrium_andersonii.AAC.4
MCFAPAPSAVGPAAVRPAPRAELTPTSRVAMLGTTLGACPACRNRSGLAQAAIVARLPSAVELRRALASAALSRLTAFGVVWRFGRPPAMPYLLHGVRRASLWLRPPVAARFGRGPSAAAHACGDRLFLVRLPSAAVFRGAVALGAPLGGHQARR